MDCLVDLVGAVIAVKLLFSSYLLERVTLVMVVIMMMVVQYAKINGTNFIVAAPVFDPVALCYHKGEHVMTGGIRSYLLLSNHHHQRDGCPSFPPFPGGKMIPVDNDSELMDRLFDFLAPTFEKEDLFLHRSPVCLPLDVREMPLFVFGVCGGGRKEGCYY